MATATETALVMAVLLADLLFSGVVFGWAPLLLMLQREQQYGELCGPLDQETGPCDAQTNRFNLIFTLGSVMTNAASLPVGVLLDHCGPKKTVVAAGVVEVTALLLLAVADSQRLDVFAPAYVMLALGGSLTMMASFPASFLIVKHQTAVLAAISCLFDGSSAMFLILYYLQTLFQLSRRTLFIAYAIAAVCIYSVLFVLWYIQEQSLMPADLEDANERRPLLDKDKHVHGPSQLSRDEQAMKEQLNENYLTYGELSEEHMCRQYDAQEIHELYLSGVIKEKVSEMTIAQQIGTFEFAYILVFSCLQVLRANVYIGTTNQVLLNYGDGLKQFLYTKIFSFVLPMGFLFVPAIDFIVEKRGLPLSMAFTNAIGALYNILLLIPSLPVQLLTFCVFTGFRAFLYAVISAFTAKTFGLNHMGTLMGFIFSLGSTLALLEYPAVLLSNRYAGGNLSTVYWISLLICVAIVPLIFAYNRREQERKIQHQRLRIEFGSTLLSPVHPDNKALGFRRS